jgi:hypothetical protein
MKDRMYWGSRISDKSCTRSEHACVCNSGMFRILTPHKWVGDLIVICRKGVVLMF